MICATFVAAYVGQELAHIATGEKTYQQSYMKFSNWPALLAVNALFASVVPGRGDAHEGSFLSWIVAHNYVVRAKLTSGKDRAAMKVIENFVTEEDRIAAARRTGGTRCLAAKEKDAFTHIAHSEPIEGMFAKRFRPDAWVVKPVYGMNEIYVASSPSQQQLRHGVLHGARRWSLGRVSVLLLVQMHVGGERKRQGFDQLHARGWMLVRRRRRRL